MNLDSNIDISRIIEDWMVFDLKNFNALDVFLTNYKRPKIYRHQLKTRNNKAFINNVLVDLAQSCNQKAEEMLEILKASFIMSAHDYVKTILYTSNGIYSSHKYLEQMQENVYKNYTIMDYDISSLTKNIEHDRTTLEKQLLDLDNYMSQFFRLRKKEEELIDIILKQIAFIIQNTEVLTKKVYACKLFESASKYLNYLSEKVYRLYPKYSLNDIVEDYIFHQEDIDPCFVNYNGYIPAFKESVFESINDLEKRISVKHNDNKVCIEMKEKIPNVDFDIQEFVFAKDYQPEQVLLIDDSVNLGLFPLYISENEKKSIPFKLFSNLSDISFYSGTNRITARIDEVESNGQSANIYTTNEGFNIVKIPYRGFYLVLILKREEERYYRCNSMQCILYHDRIATYDYNDRVSLVNDEALQFKLSKLSASVGYGSKLIFKYCISEYRLLQKFIPFNLNSLVFLKAFELILNNLFWFLRCFTISEGHEMKQIVYISDSHIDKSSEKKLKQLAQKAMALNHYPDDTVFEVVPSATTALGVIDFIDSILSPKIIIDLSLNNSQISYFDHGEKVYMSKSISLNQVLCNRLLSTSSSLCERLAQNLCTYFIQQGEIEIANEIKQYQGIDDLSILLSEVFNRNDIDLMIQNKVFDDAIIKNIVFLFFSLIYSIVQFCSKLKKDPPTLFVFYGYPTHIFKLIGDEVRLSKLSKLLLEGIPGMGNILKIDFLYIEDTSRNHNYIIDGYVWMSNHNKDKEINEVVYYGFEDEPSDIRIPITDLDEVKEKVLENYTNFLNILTKTKLSRILENLYNITDSNLMMAYKTAESSFLQAYTSWSKVETEFPKEPLFFWPQEYFLSSIDWSDIDMDIQDQDTEKKYDVFISYRRTDKEGNKTGSYIARNVYQELEKQLKKHKRFSSFEVFFDYSECTDGYFEKVILQAVRSCKFFIIILTKDVFSRCNQEIDWVRREIETAQESECKIIPVNPDNDFKKENVDKLCPSHIADIVNYQISDIQMGQLFEKSIEYMIETRFNSKKDL